MDWRNNGGNYVTSVKNQGGLRLVRVVLQLLHQGESAVRIKLGNPNYAIDLSEGFLQFCGGGGCNGWGLTSGLDFAKSTGVTDEACMPYVPNNMTCATSRCADWQNRLTKITSYSSHATTDARKTALATIGPVLAGMEVWSDFFAYTSGVYVKSASATRVGPNNTPGYHCISVVGYDDAQGCWILKNSWGNEPGEGGFARVAYGQARDLLIDTSWSFYSVVVAATGGATWQSNVTVSQVYATSRFPERVGVPRRDRLAADPARIVRRRDEPVGPAGPRPWSRACRSRSTSTRRTCTRPISRRRARRRSSRRRATPGGSDDVDCDQPDLLHPRRAECMGAPGGTNAWHRILPGVADGVTNVHLLLTAAKANNRQAYVVRDANGSITAAYV